jgi:hypothetical protein
MRIDPAVAALRDDRSLQRRAQAAMVSVREAWASLAHVAPVLAEVDSYAAGRPLGDCPALAQLFAEENGAQRFVADLCDGFAGVLAKEPFGQPPFRHAFDGTFSTLLLARGWAARLTLVAQEPGKQQAQRVAFSDAVRHEAVIAGEAVAMVVERGPEGRLAIDRRRLSKGSRTRLDLSRQALFVGRVERRLVTLRLHLSAPAAGPVREYSLADGRLLGQSSGDVRRSRQEMIVSLLGRMKRAEAAPLIAAIAVEEGPDGLRWQALREVLALDTANGFAALCRIARSPIDRLAAPAGALRAQLIEAHPTLRAFEESQCRE